MPLYDYRCSECGAQREILCRHDAKRVINCPDCEKETMARVEVNHIPKGALQFVGWWPDQQAKLDDRLARGEITKQGARHDG